MIMILLQEGLSLLQCPHNAKSCVSWNGCEAFALRRDTAARWEFPQPAPLILEEFVLLSVVQARACLIPGLLMRFVGLEDCRVAADDEIHRKICLRAIERVSRGRPYHKAEGQDRSPKKSVHRFLPGNSCPQRSDWPTLSHFLLSGCGLDYVTEMNFSRFHLVLEEFYCRISCSEWCYSISF